ncbi:uncharacterized protein LOC123984519 [Micropterus dolomieu]|uniref:uncharacterized protein LOC123984519 n=1 Tax=Micropterus dolomieu TaxID=147949 RepID=UPI001E8EC411|nr:uncharacterized protein LOC123984519 [Micropterus dolomieu]
MTHGYQIQFYRRPSVKRSPTFTSVKDPGHAEVLQTEISTLLAKAAIREVESGDPQAVFFSRYFLVPKRDGGLRPVLDLRGLNKYLRPLRCNMLTIPRVWQAIAAGDWFTPIDLKDAYFQIPIWQGHWRILRFGFKGRVFEFQVLPFGISLAPRTFTCCMDAVIAPMRQRGLRILSYLDDWLICADSEELCRRHVALLLEHIRSLGLCHNDKKSKLQPSQVITFLGMVLDSRRATLVLTPERQLALKACLCQFQLHSQVNWGLCLRLMGLMATTVQIVPLALLYMTHHRFCSLRAVHVPGPLNSAADIMSRGGPHPGEWRLHPQVVEEIWHRFGRAEADLFACGESAHCHLFFSLKSDNPPLGWDALAHPWPRGLLYAFPPFTLLQPLLRRVWVDVVRLILVATLWPHMTWFSAIPPLLDGTPWELPHRRDLLSQAGGNLFHPFPVGLRLVAWPLKGMASGP